MHLSRLLWEMELLSASEYMAEFLELQRKARAMDIVPELLLKVEHVNIPGLSAVLYLHYKNNKLRHLSVAHKNLLLLRKCYCPPVLGRCYCIDNQAVLEWCWLKFASTDELRTVAHMLAAHVENNFCY